MKDYLIMGVAVFFGIAFVIVLIRYVILKQDLKKARIQCEYIRNQNTNMVLYSSSMDSDVCAMINEFNTILFESNELKRKLLREENEIKNVVTNVSHDLRTPVTSMIGYAKLLEKEPLSEKQKEYTSVILSRANLLKELVEQLFSYSLVMEQQEYEMRQENITSILEESILMFYGDFEEKQLELELCLEEEAVYARVDKDAFRRVMINIISNALKYAQEKVILQQQGKTIIIKNKTESIDSIDVEKLFDRFFTVAKNRANGSMGLGLTIVKKLITDMNGQITAHKQDGCLVITIRLN